MVLMVPRVRRDESPTVQTVTSCSGEALEAEPMLATNLPVWSRETNHGTYSPEIPCA